MIQSFADKETELIWNGIRSRKLPPEIQDRALAKLVIIDAAEGHEDLKHPPGNRLHELKDDRLGQHAISINKQWRVCFVWKDGQAHDVEITDYH